MSRVSSRGYSWLVLVVAVALPGVVGATLSATGTPEVKFEARATAGLTIVGSTHEMLVEDDGTKLAVRVSLRRLATGIDLRDRHMKEHLDTAHFRNAELSVQRSALRVPTTGTIRASARGTLTLHGKTRPISFRYTAEHRGNVIQVRGTARVDMTQFGIEPPSYLGMSVEPVVQVSAGFDVQDH